MNKLLVFLLAVCLVSVHGFVKREAEKAEGSDLASELTKNLNSFGEKVQEMFKPENLKEGFNNFVDTVNKGIQDLKSKTSDGKQ